METSGSKEIGEEADLVQDRGREPQEEAQQPGEVAESFKAAEECPLETERVAEVDPVYGDNLEMCEHTEECLVETEERLAGGDRYGGKQSVDKGGKSVDVRQEEDEEDRSQGVVGNGETPLMLKNGSQDTK